MAESFLDLKDSRTKRKFGKPKYCEKYIDLAQCLDQLAQKENFKTNFLAYEAKQLDENKHMGLDDWISQVVV